MRGALFLLVMLFAGVHLAHAQYDYDDDYKQKKPKAPKDTEDTDDTKPAKVKKGNDGQGFEFDKMSIGGIFNFSYGSGYYDQYGTVYSNMLYLEISPIVTYQVIEDRLDLGAGIIYQFQKFDAQIQGRPFSEDYKYHTYGGRIFPRVYIWQGLFAQLEYVVQNGDVTVFDASGNTRNKRMTFHNAFLGGGYSFPLGGAGYFALLVYVNLNTNLLYPERRPFFSFGFGIGL